jgi:NADP-dependent 3-hydroxy acid dehydrogenase YdfG
VAFALAGASRVVLLGRTKASLQETAALIPNNVPSSFHVVDVCDFETVKAVATSTGVWDVLVLAAGHVSQPSYIVTADRRPRISAIIHCHRRS